ncbi:LacI family transcriptional regulator [Ruminococcaceae bacterium OttesenSCG-928-A16]|nr:LacI family transcriptional regulator [Ruminococcaceae bacterium OttesenSCG-928-A16]
MNIYDIAKEAGVSISTVSRVLNNKSNVMPATREKVQAVLDKHSYTPNAIARGLVARSMKTVAVLTVDVRVPHYARTTYIIERAFSKLNYHVLVCNTGGELEEARRYARLLAERQVDGIVLVGSIFNKLGQDEEVAACLHNIPVVSANGQPGLPNGYSVLVDDVQGIELAVEHLAQKGRQNIVYVKDLDTDSAQLKQQGFYTAMQKRGVKNAKNRVIKAEYGLAGGEEAAAQIVALRPDAVVCAEDLTAVGVMKGIINAGLKVPEDIAVIGYNNSEYSVICTPELTTVDNKVEMSALFSVQLLESLIEKDESFSSMSIQPELVVRQSS